MRLKHKEKETKMQFPKVNDNPQSLPLLNNKVERRLLGAKYNNYKKLTKYKTKQKLHLKKKKTIKKTSSLLSPRTLQYLNTIKPAKEMFLYHATIWFSINTWMGCPWSLKCIALKIHKCTLKYLQFITL